MNNVFSVTMSEDCCPVPLSGLAARLDFVEISGSVSAGCVSFAHLNHPGERPARPEFLSYSSSARPPLITASFTTFMLTGSTRISFGPIST